MRATRGCRTVCLCVSTCPVLACDLSVHPRIPAATSPHLPPHRNINRACRSSRTFEAQRRCVCGLMCFISFRKPHKITTAKKRGQSTRYPGISHTHASRVRTVPHINFGLVALQPARTTAMVWRHLTYPRKYRQRRSTAWAESMTGCQCPKKQTSSTNGGTVTNSGCLRTIVGAC